jgi:hypothetical protein
MRKLLSCSISNIDKFVSRIARQCRGNAWLRKTGRRGDFEDPVRLQDKKRVMKATKEWHLEAVEYEPQFRTIKMYQLDNERLCRKKIYSLPFPYMQFALMECGSFEFNYLYVSMTGAPIKHLVNSKAFLVPLPNISAVGEVCLGSMNPKTLEEAVSLFWMMSFDNTPWWNGVRCAERVFEGDNPYKKWDKLGLNETCEIDWICRHSLLDFVSNIGVERADFDHGTP